MDDYCAIIRGRCTKWMFLILIRFILFLLWTNRPNPIIQQADFNSFIRSWTVRICPKRSHVKCRIPWYRDVRCSARACAVIRRRPDGCSGSPRTQSSCSSRPPPGRTALRPRDWKHRVKQSEIVSNPVEFLYPSLDTEEIIIRLCINIHTVTANKKILVQKFQILSRIWGLICQSFMKCSIEKIVWKFLHFKTTWIFL